MDTCLRKGKIVYNQACWILALKNFSFLLSLINSDSEATRLKNFFIRTLHAVEEKLWSEKDGCYIDLQESNKNIGHNRIITQDVLLYLIAISENTISDNLSIQKKVTQNSKKKKIK
jgi:hypothetical protein